MKTSASSGSLIDFEQLQSACDGDHALLRELMDMYFRQADEIMAGLQKAVQERAVDEVNGLAHKLAGSSLACGLSAIVPPLRHMEINAQAGHLDGAEAAVAEAAAALETLRAAVRDYLKTLPSS